MCVRLSFYQTAMRFAIASVQKSILVDKAGVYLTGPIIEQ